MVEPLVFLPGIGCDARVFLPQIVALGEDRGTMVIPTCQAESIEDLAALALEQLPPRVVLIGQGLGGVVALEILRRAEDRVARLVLISTPAMPDPPPMVMLREERIIAARAGRLAAALREDYPPEALAQTEWRDEVLALVQDMGLSQGEGNYIRQTRALQRRPDQQKAMRRARIPALVLGGSADTLLPPRRHDFMASLLPWGKLELIADSGHLPMLEQPDATSQAIRDFLAGPILLR
jgi:pimeloyl-ACP methyl ester carboxylesterase